ncbi:MAG TPA: hypothetical protein VLA61_08120 [Ideonella sp.]|uniref:hypothetical protein n=1 Tax=Ideonella sp. TaxID=1929293 RepID=UPI002BDD8C29|nr:hypothetical protein [Ideonella sp.]HSI48218.1 hypothetical protein [Ideonella sp.]
MKSTMKSHPSQLMMATLLLGTLAGCGGGGNESGPPDVIQASPAQVTVSAVGSCAVGVGPTIFLYGGTPPYKLKNSVPTALSLDKTTVLQSGQGFTVTFIGGQCMENMPVSAEDEMGRIVEVLFTNQIAT